MEPPANKRQSLCSSCAEFTFGRDAWNAFWHDKQTRDDKGPLIKCHFTRKQLLASRTNGCWFCGYLLHNIPTDTYSQTVTVTISYQFAGGVNPTKINSATVEVHGLPQYGGRLLYLRVSAKPDSPASSFIRAPAEGEKHGIYNFDSRIALEWIEDCWSSHTECSRPDQYELPTRLLDLSSYKSNEVRLFVTGGNISRPYAALSYCWGNSNPFMTTSRSLKSRQEAIDVSDMPQTYQDAIWVAGNLGIKYLWVDALCILQDSADDKIEEISRIRLYFANAHFVIAASNASSVQEGFLRREPLEDPRCSRTERFYYGSISRLVDVPFYSPSGEGGWITLDASRKAYNPIEEPLNRRAWTLEERLLCPRVLVFPSTGGFFLHCNKEDRHNDTVDFGQPLGLSRLFSLSLATWNQQGADMEGVHKSWLILVRDYSERRLTKAEDRPIAIAGIAEAYHDKFKMQLGDYVAGHWSKYLLESLNWHVFSDAQKPAPKTARGPSWSWLSADSTVQLDSTIYFPQNFVNLVEVDFVVVRKATEKLPFGTVQAGCLTIKARVGKAFWKPSKNAKHRPLLETEHGRRLEDVVAFVDTIDNYPTQLTDIFLIPLRSSVDKSRLLGLLLQPVAPSYHRLFRRIGFFDFGPGWFLNSCSKPELVSII